MREISVRYRPVRIKRQGKIAHRIRRFLIERPLLRLLRQHRPPRFRAGLRLFCRCAGIRPLINEVEHFIDIPVRGYKIGDIHD